MLSEANIEVVSRMVQCGCSVGVIGRSQKTTDLPPHTCFRGLRLLDGRDYDIGTRGLGGTKYNPVSTVGEENVTMRDDSHYPSESILVHEFGHAVMNCGFDEIQH